MSRADMTIITTSPYGGPISGPASMKTNNNYCALLATQPTELVSFLFDAQTR